MNYLPSRLKLLLTRILGLFRRLTPDEAPPILRQIMMDQSTKTILLPEQGNEREISRELAGRFLRRTPEITTLTGIGKITSILVIGLQDQVSKWLDLNKLPPRPFNMHRDGTAHAWTIRRDGVTFVVVSARDAPSLQSLVRPLPHYGRQSYVVFDGAKIIERGTWPARVQEIVLN